MSAPTALGRVLDPGALDADEGPRGRLSIELPVAWLEGGVEVDVEVPLRLTCARCDGGGCDGCGKSGALRLADLPSRTVRVALPRGAGEGVALRLARPLGDEAGLDQLLLEIRPGPVASEGCAIVPRRGGFLRPGRSAAVPWALVVATIVALALAIAASR